jgi:hypothetical protein
VWSLVEADPSAASSWAADPAAEAPPKLGREGLAAGGKLKKWLGRAGKGRVGGRWGERAAARSPPTAGDGGG